MALLGNRLERSPHRPRDAADANLAAQQAEIAGKRRIPRGDVRRRELARVAEDVFLETGFADTTMQMIASRA